MNDLEKNEKGKNITIIILSIVLIIALVFICYDKMLNIQKTTKKECKCPICEKCISESKEENNSKDKICELDMANKTDLEVYDLCDDQGISNESNVKIRNISINNKEYVLYHVFEPFYDAKGTYVSFNGVTKLYLNGYLVDVYKGQKRQTLWRIRIDGNKLIVSETWPSEAPPVDYTYDLTDITYDGYNYDLTSLK